MKVFRIAINIATVVAVIIILLASTCFFQIFIQRKKYPILFGFSIFHIATSSMEPTINAGDKVIINVTNNLKEGDIVVYLNDDVLVCHRIQEITGNNVICKGDRNNIHDDPVSIEKIVGKVVHIIPSIAS